MRAEQVWRVAARDLLSTLRDTRTLLGTVLIPLLLIPLLMVGVPLMLGQFVGEQTETRQRVGVIGTLPRELERRLAGPRPGADSPGTAGADTAGPDTDGTAQSPTGGVDLVPLAVTASNIPQQAAAAVQSGRVDAVIYAPETLPVSGDDPGAAVQVYAKLGSLAAQAGALGKVQAAVDSYNRTLVARRLESAGLSEADLTPVALQPKDASTPQERGSGQLGFMIPLLMLNFILSGAMAAALDSTAGEKERGTLESLLVSPVRRSEVVAGKLLATTLTALCAALFSVLGLLGTGLAAGVLLQRGGQTAAMTEAFGGQLTLGAGGFVTLLLSVVGAALLISAVLIALSIYARSYKEAQTYVTPLSLLIVVPALFLQFSDGFGPGFYAIPLFGSMLAILDTVQGNLEWTTFWLSLASNLLAAAALGALALTAFGREEVIFRN